MVPELSRAQAAFIQGPVSISLAAQDAAGRMAIARGLACRVSEARDEVAILLCGVRAAALVSALRAGEGLDDRGGTRHGAPASGWVASCYSLPATHETLQLKAQDARVEPARPGDETRAAAHRAAFARQIAVGGLSEEFTEALLHHEPGRLCVVRFTPSAVYMQTPGPRAGERLRAGG